MLMSKYIFMLLGCYFYLIYPCECPAKEVLSGPIPAYVIRVVDGDTIIVSAKIWLGHKIETFVRIKGIDAPELKGQCTYEKELALKAKDFVSSAVADKEIILFEVTNDKYAGRVLAIIQTEDYPDLGEALVQAGLARPYFGKKREPWCDKINSDQPDF